MALTKRIILTMKTTDKALNFTVNAELAKMIELANQGHYLWGIGAFSGAAIGLSAYWQGKCAACACDAMGETGKGFGNYLAVLGITETVALLVMVFTLIILGKVA